MSLISPPETLDWRRADDDVLVATTAGEYAGFISLTGRGARAHSARGADLGLHDSEDSARAAVEASLPDLALSLTRSAPHHRPHRTRRRGTPGRPGGPKK